MKLDKNTRHRLFAGQTVELPLSKLGNVRQDGLYAIHTEKGKPQGQFRVLVIRKGAAFIRFDGDPVRLLAKEGGYTDFEGRALREEPEAVDEVTQKRLTKEAHERQAPGAQGGAVADKQDTTRVRKLQDLQRKARASNLDMTPLHEVLDRELERLQAQIEEAA